MFSVAESGWKDYRLLPATVTLWAACLIPVEQHHWAWWVVAVLLVLGVIIRIKGSTYEVVHLRVRERMGAKSTLAIVFYARLSGQAMMMAIIICCAFTAGEINNLVASHDGIGVALDQPVARVVARVRSPAVESVQRGSHCQFEASAESVSAGGITEVSSAQVLVFAPADACEVVEGELYSLSGELEEARFGRVLTWLTLAQPAQKLSETDFLHSAISHLRKAFLQQCSSLDEQGRILVPGVTMGVLGTQSLEMGEGENDSAAAKVIKNNFTTAGIVHLLAVSGGHFALIGDVLRRLTARLKTTRLLSFAVVIGGYFALSTLMYPSDSVLRALAMGVLAAVARVLGRPAQAMSCLCWTVIGVLLLQPSMAGSFGFALSCGAVLGIILFARPFQTFLQRRLPLHIAQATALTVSAQVLTLPIQLMMTPSLPLWSVAANVCVAPLVTVSTLCGLASLVVSWLWPSVGYFLAWCAGLGTGMMNRCAGFFAQVGSTFSSPLQGPTGAVVFITGEILILLLLRHYAKKYKYKEGIVQRIS